MATFLDYELFLTLQVSKITARNFAQKKSFKSLKRRQNTNQFSLYTALLYL